MYFKNLFNNLSTYLFIDIFNKLIPFIMIAILTRYLSPQDYGYISIFSVLVGIFSIFIGFSVVGIINTNFSKMQKEELSNFIANCILILFFSFIFVFIFVFIFKDFIYSKFDLNYTWQVLAIFTSFFGFFTTINLNLWMMEQKPKKYGIYQILNAVVMFITIILMVVVFKLKWQGQIIAIFLTSFVFGLISIVLIYRRDYFKFNINLEYIKEALNFGIPLMPHAIAGFIITSADRLIIKDILGANEVGIYATAYQFGMIMNLITASFNKAYIPELFKTLSTNPSINEKIKMVKFSYLCFFIFILLGVISGLFLGLFMKFYVGNDFIVASKYVIYFTIAFSFSGMYLVVTNYIFYVKKTKGLAAITFISSLLHLVFLYVFVGKFGLFGAVYSLVITNFIIFIFTWIYSNKVYPMPWNLLKYKKRAL
ncbi:putative polysaccharide export protein [Campylobacter blaseri]|uniref:Polysaccharide biosynthesis protein n=1 Tax=Campylobacter blaseri TaxID=2042961 RepID=A0A2P8QZ84_9BACT|nr:oligosaccharide flippase family protein [Campylobacter blaseri]PSM51557.1 polysaccharide biosynthesis protein [Campylobacter blaseri]PSM53350.1 polysaccharide biosynthesis protein [Campylobacter blaseri]QKF86644.1 putative polysaccharide export protein [Campylobacter blaseri]